jgi:hypothetical protein
MRRGREEMKVRVFGEDERGGKPFIELEIGVF